MKKITGIANISNMLQEYDNSFYCCGTLKGNLKKELIKKHHLENKKDVIIEYYKLSNLCYEEKQKQMLKKYNNICFWTAAPEYAPELKKHILFAFNKVIY